jgi:transcriptional regulator of acetoin/glycerol metabolism
MVPATPGLPSSLPFAQRAILGAFQQNVDIEASKRRCLERYNLDEAMKRKIICLTAPEIAEHREPFGGLLEMIAEELDYVSVPLSSVSFGASFSNMAGTILYYCSDRSAGHYVDAEREGALWAEGIAGTNGVGTCIVEKRPTQVFRSQHFFRDHAHMSCTAVPVLSAEAEMFGVLNFSSANPTIRPETFTLVSGLVRQTAERLNNQLFRASYGANTMLRARSADGPLLLALDGEHRLIGANMLARHWLGLTEGPLRPASLEAMFDHGPGLDDLVARGGNMLARPPQGEEVRFKILPGKINRQTNGELRRTAPPIQAARNVPHSAPVIEECLGASPGMPAQAAALRRLAGSRLPVLLLGETGTGKDTLARALHRQGSRRDKPFVTFNCAAVPETLIDSELFGYSGGAFTGARREGSAGRLLEADGGTLFLDEIGDMPIALQTRLLRVLESGEVSPLGSGRTRIIDVQVIAATNRNLRAKIQEKNFRSDLYHRLSGFVVNMPPLRERGDKHAIILKTLRRLQGDQEIELAGDALARLQAYDWPGNIRELGHVLQRAIQLCQGNLVQADDLLLDQEVEPRFADVAGDLVLEDNARAIRFAAERASFIKCLQQNGGDLMKVAQALRISRATVYRKMKQFRTGQRGQPPQ